MSNEKVKLIDCHAHTSGISACCKSTAEEVILEAKKIGIDGIILTNHYAMKLIHNKKLFSDTADMAKKYIEEYKLTKAIGEKHGITVFFGIEVAMELYKPAELLIYGVSEEFLLDNIDMCYYTQEKLYNAVKAVGGAVIQAHPLRIRKSLLLDPKFFDGVEANCHLLYDGTHYEEMSKVAHDNGLIITCGGDYHGDTDRSYCGMYLPDSIKDTYDFAKYILNTDSVHLLMQEPDQSESYEKIFIRNKGDAK